MRQRSSYSKSFKTQVVQECLQPGVSIASVALRHGINANLVRKWIPVYRDHQVPALPAFVPLKLESGPRPNQQMPVSIEVVFGQQTLTVKWPSSDPEGCARFIRGLIAAIEAELQALQAAPTQPEKKQKPKRAALPAEFPRTLIHHEPDNTHCSCGCALKRIGEDVSEKLDYTPGVFTVERHVRGKWVCDDCETLIQAPVPAQIIDKGIPTANAASK